MTWDPAIRVAFDNGDGESFRRLLSIHPEFLRSPDGGDRWMWLAAVDGKLAIIQSLVDLGMNVNESSDMGDPEDPFYEPEGPILRAAGSGQLEVLRWLLDHGAKINYVVQGMPRCLPLVRACSEGHLPVVKLLVEHGADIHATWRGLNAITQAENFGHWNIRNYLRSLGARSLRETTPPDFASAHAQFVAQMVQLRGPISDWSIKIPGNPLVTLRVIPANDKCDVKTVFTIGLSDCQLPQGQNESSCTELRCMLPRDWPLTDAALEDPLLNWPIESLKTIINKLRVARRLPDEPITFMNGDPPTQLASNTALCGWLCVKAAEETVGSRDHRWIDIHSLFPIYIEEVAMIRQSGYGELINQFLTNEIPLFIDPQRRNVG